MALCERNAAGIRLGATAQVSQFTLYALAKGNKPDYHLAMPPDQARSLGVVMRCDCRVQQNKH